MANAKSFPAPPEAGPCWRLKVTIATLIFCLSVSAVPIYNKLVFAQGVYTRAGSLHKYPYPIATAFLQLGVVSLVLAVVNTVGHFCCDRNHSWIFGPHFAYKLRHVAPVGILFGLKYGITNWGLQLVPVGIHLLLQSTDVIWTILLAAVVNHEDIGLVEVLAAVLSAAGSCLIGLHAVHTLEAPFIPLLVNLLPPFLLALCVSTLRTGASELFRLDNRLEGSITPTEFTCLKLALSSITALAFAMLCEHGSSEHDSWWEALLDESPTGLQLMFLGCIFVLVFQVNLTWLAGLTSAATVGIIGGVKVIPQWSMNALFQLKVDLSPLNIGGAMLVLLGSTLYAAASGTSKLVVQCEENPLTVSIRWEKRPLDLEEKLLEPGNATSKSHVFFTTPGVLLDVATPSQRV